MSSGQISIAHHETIKNSPFRVTFGAEPQIGLGSAIVPQEMIGNIQTEEDLENILNTDGEEEDECIKDGEVIEEPVEDSGRMCEVPSESFIEVCEAGAVTHLLKEFMPGDNVAGRRCLFEAHAPPTNLVTGNCVVLANKGECPACNLARNS